MATKTAKKVDENVLTAYNMKTKEKGCVIQDPVISLKNGKFIAKGHDGDGNTLTTILSQTRAEKALEDGIAKAGEGIAKAKKK